MKGPSVLGAALLVAGQAIGAAMLGLPILTGLGGFVPAVVLLTLIWLYMTCTGLLLLEVNLRMEPGVNVVTMARSTLGPLGGGAAWLIYLFLLYGLMVAFLSGGATVLGAIIERIIGIDLPVWAMMIPSLLIYGGLLYLGARAIDSINQVLMVGLIIAYILLVVGGVGHVVPERLAHHDWGAAWWALPAIVTSFGYQPIIPTLRVYLHNNVHKLRRAIVLGTLLPLLIYLVWEAIILGVVPLEGEQGIRTALEQGIEATTMLRGSSGALFVTDVAQWFALFAIVTTFLGLSLSFVDFLADGLRIRKTRKTLLGLCAMVLLPHFGIALVNPAIFLSALGFAGGICAVLIFGVMPTLMAMVMRRRSRGQHLVPGGSWPLAGCILVSVVIFIIEMVSLVSK
jgi:tyrosine-specific transport protein